MKLRKKILAILLAAILCCGLLTGCGKEELNLDSYGGQTSEDEKLPEDKVLTVLFASSDGSMLATKAMDQLKEKYPDHTVEVTFVPMHEDYGTAQMIRMKTQMMAGEGPDVIFVDRGFIEFDIYKIMQAGAFVDLQPYFDADEEWNWDNYNMDVINGMKMEGKMYLLPLTYELPLLYTSKTAAERVGFNLDNCQSGKGLLTEMISYYERSKEDSSLCPLFMLDGHLAEDIVYNLQLCPIDYQNWKLNWDENTEEGLGLYQQFYPIDYRKVEIPNYHLSEVTPTTAHIGVGDYLFLDRVFDYRKTLSEAVDDLSNLSDPVAVPVMSYDGTGITAKVEMMIGMSPTCKEKEVGYEFIKSTLDQGTHIALRNMSVCKSATALKGGVINNQIQELTKKITYTYFQTNDYSIDMTAGFFSNYFKGTQSLENALRIADERLKIYISE